MYANICRNFKRQKCDNVKKKEAEQILKYKRPYDRNTSHVKHKNKCDTSNSRGKWNHLKIIQKIPEQHTWKAHKTAILSTTHLLRKILM